MLCLWCNSLSVDELGFVLSWLVQKWKPHHCYGNIKRSWIKRQTDQEREKWSGEAKQITNHPEKKHSEVQVLTPVKFLLDCKNEIANQKLKHQTPHILELQEIDIAPAITKETNCWVISELTNKSSKGGGGEIKKGKRRYV